MEKVLITGGTGLIGKALSTELLKRGYRVIVLSRGVASASSVSGITYANWDPERQFIDEDAIEECDHLVHLAGAGIADKRWTTRRKKEIINSRVKSSEFLVSVLKERPNKIRTVISASAIGWYGPDPSIPNSRPFNEEDPSSDDFLGHTCQQWEASIDQMEQLGKRLIKIRTGHVLSEHGGLMKELMKPMRLGVATILGKGNQVISWIHISDLVRIYALAIEDASLHGVYNAVAPRPASNKELVLKIAQAKKGKFFIPVYVPAFVLRLILGEMSVEILKSTTVSSAKISKAGFNFAYPSLQAALNLLYFRVYINNKTP